MKNIIDFKLKKFEKELRELVDKVGIAEFEERDLEVHLSDYEKNLLVKSTERAIEALSYCIEDDKDNLPLNVAIEDQYELLQLLDESLYYNETLFLQPHQYKWIFLSLELGGDIDTDEKNVNSTQYNDKDHQVLNNIYRNILEQCKIIEKIISPWETPEYLKGK